MGTGIGARNLADADRHDLLPVVAGLHSFDADLRPNFVHHRRAQPVAASAPSP
jgi:nitric oxide synthase oxygenase domain/subunit